ncbi:MAG: mannonate dehydratase, partial [Planctomycetaceae bacterium]|nr:mannonate dehydratase [Planctomycetaceae bacterium]
MPKINNLSRRDFCLGAAAAVLAGTRKRAAAQKPGPDASAEKPAPTAKGYPLVVPGYFGSRPGIQLGTQLPATASEDDMRFTRQLGVEWVMTSLPPEENTLENYQALIRRFAKEGLKIYRLANDACHNMEEVTLNLPGRDAKIEEYLAYIRLLGKAGIHYSTYAHMGNGIWSSERETTRGGATARALRLDTATGRWAGKTWQQPLSHGRRYTEEELWDNYTFFIRKVVPVAEEAGVYIGIHPDDPPVYDLGGVPRCIFGNFAGYVRALEIASSPNIGVCLCVGSWIEGGERTGKHVVDAIRHFASQKKLFKIHFRNVSEPLPKGFVETFPDDGYVDMSRMMRALAESGYTGAVISDHLPNMVGGR